MLHSVSLSDDPTCSYSCQLNLAEETHFDTDILILSLVFRKFTTFLSSLHSIINLIINE